MLLARPFGIFKITESVYPIIFILLISLLLVGSVGIIAVMVFQQKTALVNESGLLYLAHSKTLDVDVLSSLKQTKMATRSGAIASTVALVASQAASSKSKRSVIPSDEPPITTPANTRKWQIRSVSSMKETKDRVCNQRDALFIAKWTQTAKELGVNYVAVETPYDNPSCASSVTYTAKWVDAIRRQGLNVWHRHMPLAFEAIYNTPKRVDDYIPMIVSYIKTNPTLFGPNDIFTPIPEPQNGGIKGITYCQNDLCQFENKEAFNAWLRRAMTESKAAFAAIGKPGVKVGYYGFDGFVAWGHNNPDWEGILEDETVKQMGNITIDHYPEAVGTSMTNDLKELAAKYPGVPIIIGEWGATAGGDTVASVKQNMGAAAANPAVTGFNYWHMGVGGNEALIEDNFTKLAAYSEVQKYFR